MRDRKRLEEFISSDGRIRAMTDDLDTLFDLAREGESVADDIERDMKSYAELLDRIETALLLSGDKAECSAIVTIHPGAGGTESQDWAEMLLRMYLRWAEREGFQTVITDRQLAREAGGYDIIIIDTKGRPEEDDLREMVEYSDMVVVPCFAEAQALGTLRHLREKFQKLNSAKYRILLTNIPPLPQQDGPQCRALLIELEIPLFDTPIRSLKAFKKASFAGTTVATLRDDPRASLGWSDYQAVGEQIEALLGLPDLYSESPVIEESELSLQEALI